jgi:TIGR03009 family protein
MRTWLSSVPALLFVVSVAQAQQAPGNPAPISADPRVDAVLGYWEKAMLNVQKLTAEVHRIKLDKTFQKTEVFEGQAKFMRGGTGQMSKASLELYKKNQPQVFEKYLCTGNFLYQWSPAEKVIRRHELPTPKAGQVADDNFLSFMFGMKAEDAKSRYQITYVPPQAGDRYYQYLRIQPKQAADRVDFTEARLTLWASNYLPRQLWFLEPNGNEVTWDFPNLTTPANVGAADFGHPQLPQGWQFVAVPRQEPAPRVLRNSGQ